MSNRGQHPGLALLGPSQQGAGRSNTGPDGSCGIDYLTFRPQAGWTNNRRPTAFADQAHIRYAALPGSNVKEYCVKAFLVLDFSVHDLKGFIPYAKSVPTYIERHCGKYIVRGALPKSIEGNWSPERMVIIEFPSRKNPEQFLADPDFQELAKIRHSTTTSKLVLVDGE